jgi:hypothetical protein
MRLVENDVAALMQESQSGSSGFATMASFMSSLIQGSIAISNAADGEKFTVDIVDDNAKLNLDHHHGIRYTQSLVAMRRNRSENRQVSRWENQIPPARVSEPFLSTSNSHRLKNPALATSNFKRKVFQKSTSEGIIMQMPMRSDSPRLSSKTHEISYQKAGKKALGNATWTSADVTPSGGSKLFDLVLSPGPSNMLAQAAANAKSLGDTAILLPQRRISKEPNEHEFSPAPPRRKKSLEETEDSNEVLEEVETETFSMSNKSQDDEKNQIAAGFYSDKSLLPDRQNKHRSVSPKRCSRDSSNQSLSSSEHSPLRSPTVDRLPRKTTPDGHAMLFSSPAGPLTKDIILDARIDGK